MEFIIKAIVVILLNAFAFLTGFYLAEGRKNKKLQHPDESPKVSTNEDEKKFCDCINSQPYVIDTSGYMRCKYCGKDIKTK